MLGEAGATVYCTGRSSRAQERNGRPETVEETAELVNAAGGVGIAVRVDHSVESEVAALFQRIGREHKRLDLLVNVLGGPQVTAWTKFWEQQVEDGLHFYDTWVLPHLITARHAVPIMVKQKSGLLIEIIEGNEIGYRGTFYWDLATTALKRMMFGLAWELWDHKVAALSVAPGFMRTEFVLDEFGVTESDWRDAIESPKAKQFGFAGSETPCFVGRAVAALAADEKVLSKSGGVYGSWDLAEEYGFTDVNGERPHWGRYGVENFPQFFAKPTSGPKQWEVVSVGA